MVTINLTDLRQRQAQLEKVLEALLELPALEGYWIDSATDQGYGVVRYRLCHFAGGRYTNGKLKKRRQSIKPHELARIRAQVERGNKLKLVKAELEQVMGAIADIECRIRELTGS
ncbi:MAG: hypothetical protein ACFBSF_17395 [Leptolyngbyaceae cyanobacterium]